MAFSLSIGTTNYTLHGKNIVHMTQGSNEPHFFYDAQNKPAVVVFNGTPYCYVKNLQGDIAAILDSNSNVVVQYKYDAWGRIISKTGSLASTLGTLNPFRYRGYVFDEETGLYYLRNRYYISSLQRFLNADESFAEKNKYSYCKNSPITRLDLDGHCTACAVTHTDYEIVYDVPVYSQGDRGLCWAYCQIMREEFDNKCEFGSEYSYISQAEADERSLLLAAQFHGIYCQGTSCDLELTQHGGFPLTIPPTLSYEFLSIPSIQALYDYLVEHGPLYVAYRETVESSGKSEEYLSGHAVLVTGVNLYNKKVCMVNPWGIAGQYSYENFTQGFIYWPEEQKRIGLPIFSSYSNMPFHSYAFFCE